MHITSSLLKSHRTSTDAPEILKSQPQELSEGGTGHQEVRRHLSCCLPESRECRHGLSFFPTKAKGSESGQAKERMRMHFAKIFDIYSTLLARCVRVMDIALKGCTPTVTPAPERHTGCGVTASRGTVFVS